MGALDTVMLSHRHVNFLLQNLGPRVEDSDKVLGGDGGYQTSYGKAVR
jgi:hypothetical protein